MSGIYYMLQKGIMSVLKTTYYSFSQFTKSYNKSQLQRIAILCHTKMVQYPVQYLIQHISANARSDIEEKTLILSLTNLPDQ